MSCLSILKLPKNCNILLSGISKLYIIAFKDLNVLPASNKVYSFDSNGTVNNINIVSGKSFAEIGTIKNSVNCSSSLSKDKQKGISYYTTTVTASISGISKINTDFILSVLTQNVVVAVKTKSGIYKIVGLDNELILSQITAMTGISGEDTNGYTLTFEGNSVNQPFTVNPSLIIPLPDAPTQDLELIYELTNVSIGATEAIFQFD